MKLHHIVGSKNPKVEQVPQKYNYDCGVAIYKSLLDTYKHKERNYQRLINELETDKKSGTDSKSLYSALSKAGFDCEYYESYNIKELVRQLKKKNLVIILLQSGINDDNKVAGEAGHFVLALSCDDKMVYFMDPTKPNSRGYLDYNDLDIQWYDDGDGKDYYRIAIIINNPGQTKTTVSVPNTAEKVN